ncbi:DUF914-domain-containing protein [Lichtheimia hyalospora FSU 10163]|nr:DUF914-domain-containing protein [Lichtheimia hyalospora FSU 10163]
MNHTSEDLEKQSKVLDIDELEHEKVHEGQENPDQKDVWTWKGKTWKQRLAFLTRKEFLRVLILGQILSLCITGTVVINNKLTEEFNFNAPTTQTFLVYAVLAVVYNSYAIWKRGIKGWAMQFWERGVYYFFLGWVDVEGNYLVVKAYQYTGMLSVMILDTWSTPVCVLLAFIFFRVRYRWVQYLGIFLALCGTGMVVGSDAMLGNSWLASDPVKGNFFVIVGATFYGISNTSVEYLSRKYPIYEVNGSFTLFATLINLVQLMILERNEFANFKDNSFEVGLIIIYVVCMVVLYSLAPLMFRWGSAVMYNLSLMTSDFYSLIFGLGLFGQTVSVLYPPAYVIIIVGIAVYYIFPAPEPVAITDPNDPTKPHRQFSWFGFYFKKIPAQVQPEPVESVPHEHVEVIQDNDDTKASEAKV